MLGIQISLRTTNRLRKEANTRWILNADAVPVPGVSYIWQDDALWSDVAIWKD